MDKKEKAVCEAARAHYDAQRRLYAMRAMNTPTDPDERRAAYEALQVAEAEAGRLSLALDRAKQQYRES